eukprot:gnl/TRDRNA2_/TRDRNA2_35111_c0_seq1.p1 gnl/TRDRNA2_/TRDRNA2_35111_c0~~gnl/TRDRNA2_/TRDRNA2_35111_c0_seq1.p1  ORF type:complete len:232 (-),score=36.66 gnl/TRDRNA2_/TRDRNA2_35111_c0_seq1:267-962(-)
MLTANKRLPLAELLLQEVTTCSTHGMRKVLALTSFLFALGLVMIHCSNGIGRHTTRDASITMVGMPIAHQSRAAKAPTLVVAPRSALLMRTPARARSAICGTFELSRPRLRALRALCSNAANADDGSALEKVLDAIAELSRKVDALDSKIDRLSKESPSDPSDSVSSTVAPSSGTVDSWDGTIDETAYFDDEDTDNDLADWRDVQRAKKMLEAMSNEQGSDDEENTNKKDR